MHGIYVRERDFYYPFDENVAGKKVTSFEQLLQVLDSGNYVSPARRQTSPSPEVLGKDDTKERK